MRPSPIRLAAVLVLACAAGLGGPAGAASTASSASSAGSASLGSLSDSIQGSSNSSSQTTRTAQGDYRVIEVAQAGDAAGRLRVTLQADAGNAAELQRFDLLLPAVAAEQGQLAPGAVVTALARPYGVEFRSAATDAAFFLAVQDEWMAELSQRAV